MKVSVPLSVRKRSSSDHLSLLASTVLGTLVETAAEFEIKTLALGSKDVRAAAESSIVVYRRYGAFWVA